MRENASEYFYTQDRHILLQCRYYNISLFFFSPSSGINKIGLKAECLSEAGALQALPPLILYIHQFIRALSSFHLHYHQDH